MHLCVALLKAGYRVGSIDLDAGQASLSRYIDNRDAAAKRLERPLELPRHRRLDPETSATLSGEAARRTLQDCYEQIGAVDVVVLDTPGADTEASRAGHALADVLITPVNDSLMDLDILADLDPVRRQVTAPSHYTKRVWEIVNTRAAQDSPAIDWLVLRNRLSHTLAHNAREIDRLLPLLAKRIGFRVASGLRERVVYRELFLDGLTVLDLNPSELALSQSRKHALQEVLRLIADIGLALPPGMALEPEPKATVSYAAPAA
jgi:chromosome partitioning protein